MNLSYWEYNSWFTNTDFTLVGSGIVGLNCALHLRRRFPRARILVLESGILPQGASTKNAGFACFGSISEILADLEQNSEEEVLTLVRKRWNGILQLRKLLGDKVIDFQNLGGHEVFLQEQQELYENCLQRLNTVNRLLKPVFGQAPFIKQPNRFQFGKVQDDYITHTFEGQLDTGKMMQALLHRAGNEGILVLNGLEVQTFDEQASGVKVVTKHFEFLTQRLLLTTNGFSARLLNEQVTPARAQVLITQPIENLNIEGTFHLDRGYYYFRNIHNRLLIGGGRNLDFRGETTMEPGQTALIQERLEQLLKEVVLPGIPFEVAQRWSGIMGLGNRKHPIVKQISDKVFCGVRLGGMGIAIGSLVGKELADLVSESAVKGVR
jgi:glycine/D-amino acid oxidase-like deaminating enzyme